MLETDIIDYEVVKSDSEGTLFVYGRSGILKLITPNTPRHVILRGDVNDVVGIMYLPVPNGGNGTIMEFYNTLPFGVYDRKYQFIGNGCGIYIRESSRKTEWLFTEDYAMLVYNDGDWHISDEYNRNGYFTGVSSSVMPI